MHQLDAEAAGIDFPEEAVSASPCDQPPIGFAGQRRIRVNLRRLFRYGATSGLALGVSELTLVVVYASGVAGAALASLIANISGTVPSYLLSRYWIWSDSDRKKPGRQVALYWLTSAVSMALTSGAMALIADASPKGRRTHVIVVGIGFVFVSAFLWIAKYLVYQRVIFRQSTGDVMIAHHGDDLDAERYGSSSILESTSAS
jgi:putative flippase GtrA